MRTAARSARGVVAAAGLILAFSSLAACGGEERKPEDVAAVELTRVLAEGSLGPVSAQFKTIGAPLRFGDRFPCVWEITAGPGAALEDLVLGARLGHLRIRSKKEPEKDGGVVRHRIVVEAERTGTNFVSLPSVLFAISDGEGKGTTRSLDLAGFELEVEGVDASARADLTAVKAALGPLSLPPKDRGRLTLWTAIAGAVILLLLAVGWRFVRRGAVARSVAEIDPAEEARRELDRLLAKGLLAEQRFGEFYLALTAIVRRFVERTTGVHAPKQTTEEFLREIAGRKLFAAERERAFSEFLNAADLVKFAAQVPHAVEIEGAVNAAKSFCGLVPAAEGAR